MQCVRVKFGNPFVWEASNVLDLIQSLDHHLTLLCWIPLLLSLKVPKTICLNAAKGLDISNYFLAFTKIRIFCLFRGSIWKSSLTLGNNDCQTAFPTSCLREEHQRLAAQSMLGSIAHSGPPHRFRNKAQGNALETCRAMKNPGRLAPASRCNSNLFWSKLSVCKSQVQIRRNLD